MKNKAKIFLVAVFFAFFILMLSTASATPTNLSPAIQMRDKVGAGTYVYVPNAGSNSISVIDTATNAVIADIKVGASPWATAFNPVETRVYVSNTVDNNVSVIDPKTNTVVDSVNVGINPYWLAITPDGKKVYVTNYGSDNVSVIDTATNKVIASIDAGHGPHDIDITPDGKKVYVANRRDGTIVSVIDTTTDTVSASVDVRYTPFGVGVTPDGRTVYVTDDYSDTISIIDTATDNLIATKYIGTGGPLGITFNLEGTKAYLANEFSDSISVLDTATNVVMDRIHVGRCPRGSTITPDGNKLYVGNTGGYTIPSNTVSVIDTATNTVINTVTVGNNPGIPGIVTFSNPVPSNPVASFTTSVVSGEVPLTVSFTDTSTGNNINSWIWDFGNGNKSTSRNVEETYNKLGTYIASLTVTNDAGTSSTYSVTITVTDTNPPIITASDKQILLWPPDHKYQTVSIKDFVNSVRDTGDPSVDVSKVVIASVSSDEPEDALGKGDGNTTADIVIKDSQTVELRAERQGDGNGRVYTINYEVSDASSNIAKGSSQIWVSDNQGKGSTAINDGAAKGYTVYPPK